jgi:hypothetical protein
MLHSPLTRLIFCSMIGLLSIAATGKDVTANSNTLLQPTFPAHNPTTINIAQSNSSNANQFLDDRSSPGQLLKSYYNAINRQEYVRAYSYWGALGNSSTSQPPAYPQFKAGYDNTKAVQLTTGKLTSEGAAGSVYFQVPVMLNVTNTNGSKHSFIGCYSIRQVNPQNFAVPPFKPMHIDSAKIREVNNRNGKTALMTQSCQ